MKKYSSPKSHKTEEKILKIAQTIFYKKGFAGTRMQEIADASGINKALLHYYFKNKRSLFEKIFRESAALIISKIFPILNKPLPLKAKLEAVFDELTNLILDNPYLPTFILHEVSQNPKLLQKLATENNEQLQTFLKQLNLELKFENRKFSNSDHFLLNFISLCVFPFVAKPMLKGFFSLDDKNFKTFIKERKKIIIELLLNYE